WVRISSFIRLLDKGYSFFESGPILLPAAAYCATALLPPPGPAACLTGKGVAKTGLNHTSLKYFVFQSLQTKKKGLSRRSLSACWRLLIPASPFFLALAHIKYFVIQS
ncbi:hypothetical protein, partial [Cesiribacter andamanensis]|uniref:hypothetical protein n=1 Tax=Cesiribacter andamanensis TaxID=649507 RepID=UPI001F22E36E